MTNLSDQPWKIARMNKFTYALALGAGLVLSLAAPNAQADPIVQTLTPTTMSASQFNSLFTPTTTVLTSSYAFHEHPNAGVVESQVFTGTGAAAGMYAYAYQFGVNNAHGHLDQPADQRQQRVDAVQRDSGRHRLHSTGTNTSAYVVTERSSRRDQHAAGRARQRRFRRRRRSPGCRGTSTGSLTFQYLNPTTSTGPLAAGAMSGTIVVISTQPVHPAVT